MKLEDCEGCTLFSDKFKCFWFYTDLVCPCSVCLVKAMCSGEEGICCEEFVKYKKDIERYKEG